MNGGGKELGFDRERRPSGSSRLVLQHLDAEGAKIWGGSENWLRR